MDELAGKRIKEMRKKLSLSQEQLGKKVGVTKAQISRLELGINKVTPTIAKLICKEYNIDYLWLTEGADVPMIVEQPDVILDSLCNKYDLTSKERLLLELFINMSPEMREQFLDILEYFTQLKK